MQIQTTAASPLPPLSVDLVRAALRSDDTPKDWTLADIERALLRYRRFLSLVMASPRTPIAPTRDIDVMWHLHMLSPRAYFSDCMRLFGELLDHDGGFGKGEGEEAPLIACYEHTRRRYEAAFGEPYGPATNADHAQGGDADPAAHKCWHDCQSRCWHACQSKLELH
jgi:hypothetical protein